MEITYPATRGRFYQGQLFVSPSPAGWSGLQVVVRWLPLLQPHSKGITFTEDTHFQIRLYAATSTLPQAWTSKHSSPKGLCPVTVPPGSSAYTCFVHRRFLYRQHCCPHHPALPSASPSAFPKGPPSAVSLQPIVSSTSGFSEALLWTCS